MKNYNTKKYTSRKDYSCSLKLDTFFTMESGGLDCNHKHRKLNAY